MSAAAINEGQKLRILSGDLLIADKLYRFPTGKKKLDTEINHILNAHDGNRGGKVRLTKEEYERLDDLITKYRVRRKDLHPGGSSANTLVTLCRLLGVEERPDIDFLGIVSTDEAPATTKIKADLREAGIELIPGEREDAQTATSFVFVEKDGTRTIATYPGNAKEIITPEMVPDEFDVVFVQGSLWQKFKPEVAEAMVAKCEAQGRELWLSLPTHAQFNGDGQTREDYQKLIAKADIVGGNEEEVSNVLGDEQKNTELHALRARLQSLGKGKEHQDERKSLEDEIESLSAENLEKALGRLQEILDAKPEGNRAIAFISCGKEGAVVLEKGKYPHHVETIPTEPFRSGFKGKKSMLGAGDSAFAGFLTGIMKGMSGLDSAQLAMEVAAMKLFSDGARIPDIETALTKLENLTQAVTQMARRTIFRGQNDEVNRLSEARGKGKGYDHIDSAEPLSDGTKPISPSMARVVSDHLAYEAPRDSTDRVHRDRTFPRPSLNNVEATGANKDGSPQLS